MARSASFSCAGVMLPTSIIACSTSRPRAAAALGSTRGEKREGARGSPAITADCHRLSCLAEMPKYICAAASTPQAPEPR